MADLKELGASILRSLVELGIDLVHRAIELHVVWIEEDIRHLHTFFLLCPWLPQLGRRLRNSLVLFLGRGGID